MNKLEFILEKYKYSNDNYVFFTKILIDGIELIDLIKEIELPYAIADNREKRAGAYKYMEAEQLYNNLQHKHGYRHLRNAYASILTCSCGEEGCGSIDVKIINKANKIYWCKMSHPRKLDWDYSKIKEFVFDKVLYNTEIEKLKAHFSSK